VRSVFIHGCSAAVGTDGFLRVREDAAGEVVLEENNLARAKDPVVRVPAEK
jgi:hypothetical protein